MYGNNMYSKIQYAFNSDISDEELKPYVPDLIKYLPQFYKYSLMEQIQNSDAKEIGLVNYNLNDLQNQFFIDTATWGLGFWEEFFDIATDLNKDYEARREIIKAKLRGTGTCTIERIKNMSEAFSGGEVSVTENNSDYSFIVRFVGIKGIPKNLEALKEAIETLKPAHLNYAFMYTFTVWNFISKNIWNDFKSTTWGQIKIYEG